MADRETNRFHVGGNEKLQVIRYGREEMTQYELVASEAIMPGQALMRTTDADGDPQFALHDGDETNEVYVAVEASGRGMNAQTDGGYAADDLVIAVSASGGGLNLSLAVGENAAEGDTIGPEAGTGNFIGYTDGTATFPYAEAGEGLDATGLDDPALIRTEVQG